MPVGGSRLKDTHVVTLSVLVVYAVLNMRIGGGFWVAYGLRPGLWALLAYLIIRLPKPRPLGKERFVVILNQVAVLTAVLQLSLGILFGLVEGFGRSPYSFRLQGILMNLWWVSTEIAGMELSRAWLINKTANRKHFGKVLMVAILFAILALPLGTILGLREKLAIVRFLGGQALPELSRSLFCSFMAFLGGPVPAIIYKAITYGFSWFCPILPNLSWAIEAMVSTVVPILGLMLVQSEYVAEARPRRRRGDEGKEAGSLIIISLASMLVIWFAVGLFPIYPTVIVSGSMRPAIEVGDIVIASKKPKDIKVGDVIEFSREGMWVVHRVIEVHQYDGKTMYTTKGDANNVEDADMVPVEAVRGKMMRIVPKIGKLSLGIKGLMAR